jgi:hypothetical protein
MKFQMIEATSINSDNQRAMKIALNLKTMAE